MMNNTTAYDPNKDYSPVSTCVELYDSIWVLCNHIDDFIMGLIHDDILGDSDITDADILDAVFEKVYHKINKFCSENRGDFRVIMAATEIGIVPADKIRSVKMASIKTRHILAYAKIELETTLQELQETPIPEEMKELWEQIEPGFMELVARCQAGLEDAETLVNKVEELTKDL